MSENGNLDYSVNINDTDLLRLVEDLKKTQAELRKLSRDAGDVAASMAKYEAIDFSKMVSQTQKSGGNNAVKSLIADSAAATGGVNKITSALFGMNAILSGNIKSIALMAGRGGLITGTFLAAYEVGKRLAELTYGLLDKLVAMPGDNGFVEYYKNSANAAQVFMRQNQIAMDKAVKDANNAADEIIKGLARIEKTNSRRSSVESSTSKYKLAAGDITPEADLEVTRQGRIRAALEKKSFAERSFRTASQSAGSVKLVADQAQFDYENIRSQAGGSESPEMLAALKNAKAVRDKTKEQFEAAMKTVVEIRQTLTDTVADANAEIENANNDAATQFESIQKSKASKSFSETQATDKEEGDARKARLVIESQRKYHEKYDPMSDQEKLGVTNRNIGKWKENLAGASTEKERLGATEKLEAQYQERDRLKKRITESASKGQDESTGRADRIKDATDNISKARQKQTGGASLGDAFSRMYDVKKGRTPSDAAAQQTADNTRIIAENTAQLKQLGAVQ
jgi:hypothetical protein